jgi:superfamily I DNA/RNA helicase
MSRALSAAVPACLVDEYQDTNHAQYQLMRELVGAATAGDGRETLTRRAERARRRR